MDDFEETFVLDDLLSFLSCKLNKCNKSILLQTVRDFYPKEVISSSLTTLLESLPTTYDTPDKNTDPLEIIFECLQVLPEEDKPVFLCRNLDNIPVFTMDSNNEWLSEAMMIKNEQENMTQQLEEISSLVQVLEKRFQSAQEKINSNFAKRNNDIEKVRAVEDNSVLSKQDETMQVSETLPEAVNIKMENVASGIGKKIIFIQEEDGKLRMVKP